MSVYSKIREESLSHISFKMWTFLTKVRLRLSLIIFCGPHYTQKAYIYLASFNSLHLFIVCA